MNFDYRFGTEATFADWVNEGISKAESMLNTFEYENIPDDIPHENQDK